MVSRRRSRVFLRGISIVTMNMIIMIITMGVNLTVMKYELRQGKKLQSDILVVDAMHTRADLLTSASVIISLIGIKLGFPMIDPIVTVLIAGFIAYGAFEIIKTESAILCDAIAIRDPKQIEGIVLKVDGVKSCHKIRTRGRLDDIHIDLHIQLDPATRMDHAHDISYAIEDAIKTEIPSVSDVLVHLEPTEKRKRNKA